MSVYAEEFFFNPNMDFTAFIPIFIIMAALIAIVFIIAFAWYYRQIEMRQAKDMHRFRSHAVDYGLEKNDILLLLRWARWSKTHHYARLLTNAEAYEKLIRTVEKKNNATKQYLRYTQQAASRIRLQLFGKDIMPDQKVESSYDLRPGLRLFLRYVDYADTAVWGHLIDVEDEGLIVVVPNKKEVKIPLRPDTSLEVTVYIPNHDPVTFNTAVLKNIPGPRIMIVLEHSTFMLPKHMKYPTMPSKLPPMVAHAAT